jgi:diguanylate cyclase (GGDEF)-like protein/PAS domain S-box-containing protein
MRYDGELQRIYSNPAAKTLMPFAGGQHYDERLDQLGISRNQLERWRGRLQRALTTGEPTTYEWSAAPEGVEVAYETRLVPEFSPDGSPESVLVVSRDISERKRREQERQFLNDASSRLAATLDFDATLKTIIELTVPRFADACSISLFDEGDAPIRRVAVVQAGENGLAEPHPAFSTHQLTPRADFGISRVYQTGEAGLYEHIDPAQLHRELETLVDAEPLREAIRTIDMRSAMFVPFKVRGRVIGALALIYGASGRHYAESDLAFAEDLANRAAIAIDNARLYHDLERSEERLRTLVEQIPAVVFTTEAADLSRPVYLSPQIEAMTGYGSEELTDGSRSWYDIIHPDDRDLVRVSDASSIETGHERTLEYRLQTRAGESIWVREEARLIVDESGAPLNWQGIISDVTVQKELESQLTHQAFHDALTGLPNRALFSERVKLAQDRQARYAPNIAVCFMDLDNFKVINDSLGHAVGDMLLIQVAERLTRALRSDDTAARFGGDEFALLLEGIHNASDAVRVVTRIVAAFDEPFMVQGRELFVTPSVGVSIAGRDELDRRDLLREADAAMYKAKRSGKARFELYNPALTANLVNRLDLENDLRKTLNGEQLELEYQPLVELSSGRIVGVEALVRWRHPEHGLIPPGRFIPIAEETAMIVDLGRWILEDSCRRVQAWNLLRDGDFPLHLSVNLSARQFSDPSLVDDVRATLQRTGLRPDLLCLEITESVMMDDEEAAAGMLERLKELGVRLAVDDFGVGFSSLASLRRFPVDELKIDRSFVSGLIDDPNDSVIVSGVIGLAHALKLSVTAEGVETPEQHAQLVELSCDRAQGFAFSRPLSVETFEQDYLPGVCPNGASAAPELARGATIAAD